MGRVLSVFLAALTAVMTFLGLPGFTGSEEVDMNKFVLTWSDEFDGNSVDTTKWRGGWWPATPTSVRKGGYWNTKMCDVRDGVLHISTKYLENGLDGGEAGWYSSQLTTQGLFEQQYGYFEIECILPKGAGLWSAFWMMAKGVGIVGNDGVDGTEIDIYESAFYDRLFNRCVQSALHFDGYEEYHRSKVVHKTFVTGSNPYEEFNTYSLEWNENEYIFYINGKKCGSSSFGGVSKVPEYLLLSVEVGGENGQPGKSWVGKSIDTNKFAPTDFIVNYVRAYQYK
ncbi:MAG: glycoside hydrolase family 16 protein [Clostridiales bacterium]|nr:glycoside hydrolase family 16 protein [Clostridiales bacterium]